MKAYELTSWLEKKYPSDAAEDWDNVGLLTGDDTNEISHVFLALDLTEETLAEAIEDGADMISNISQQFIADVLFPESLM